jgi:multicomponent Na+:H+ antiporter subunit G
MVDTIGDVLVVAGAAWMLLATIGIVRFDDTYARMHALTKASTLGLLLVLAGAAVHLNASGAGKLALTGVFVFITAPVGAHLISRSVTRWPGAAQVHIDTVDELGTRPGPDDPEP